MINSQYTVLTQRRDLRVLTTVRVYLFGLAYPILTFIIALLFVYHTLANFGEILSSKDDSYSYKTCAAFLIAAVNLIFLDEIKIAFTSLNSDFGYIRNNRFYEKSNGKFRVFTVSGKCTFTRCLGDIIITSAPDSLKDSHSYVAVCTRSGRLHTHSVDREFVAIPLLNVDWSIKRSSD